MTVIYTFKCFEKKKPLWPGAKILKKNIYKQSKRMTTFEYSIVPKTFSLRIFYKQVCNFVSSGNDRCIRTVKNKDIYVPTWITLLNWKYTQDQCELGA